MVNIAVSSLLHCGVLHVQIGDLAKMKFWGSKIAFNFLIFGFSWIVDGFYLNDHPPLHLLKLIFSVSILLSSENPLIRQTRAEVIKTKPQSVLALDPCCIAIRWPVSCAEMLPRCCCKRWYVQSPGDGVSSSRSVQSHLVSLLPGMCLSW